MISHGKNARGLAARGKDALGTAAAVDSIMPGGLMTVGIAMDVALWTVQCLRGTGWLKHSPVKGDTHGMGMTTSRVAALWSAAGRFQSLQRTGGTSTRGAVTDGTAHAAVVITTDGTETVAIARDGTATPFMEHETSRTCQRC